uniref:Uncharacterized protein MANES_10G054300 n=1 Tax=Rhizophora mucronata TaxID=61149 RepID=A0A2P2QGB5_RHIMU
MRSSDGWMDFCFEAFVFDPPLNVFVS